MSSYKTVVQFCKLIEFVRMHIKDFTKVLRYTFILEKETPKRVQAAKVTISLWAKVQLYRINYCWDLIYRDYDIIMQQKYNTGKNGRILLLAKVLLGKVS